MPDDPKEPKAPELAGSPPKDAPKAPEKKGDDKATAAHASQPKAEKDGGKPLLSLNDDDEGDDTPDPAAAPKSRKASKAPATEPDLPRARDLEKLRKARFGDSGGSVRLDAPPPNSGRRAPAPQLVYIDESGEEVGREDYAPPPRRTRAKGADKGGK